MTARSRVLAWLSGVLPPTAVTAALVLLSALTLGGTSGPALIAAATAAALVVVLTSTGHVAWTAGRVLAGAGGASGHIEAPSAYWCALPVSHQPQRPRAPGRG